jgi:cytochrome c-type biogenesis protein
MIAHRAYYRDVPYYSIDGTRVVTPTLPIAFVAGVVSFLSPCVLPLVPSYLAYVGGSSQARRLLILRNALLFCFGFSLIFISLGASASVLGALLRTNQVALAITGGLFMVLFGLIMLGVLRLPWLYRDTRPGGPAKADKPWGAMLLGMAFAAGWTPCIGPVLGGILTLAATAGTLTQGVLLLGTYALGLALPFLLAALAMDRFIRLSKQIRRHTVWLERAAGVLLVTVGLLMISGTFTLLNSLLIRLTPAWLISRL